MEAQWQNEEIFCHWVSFVMESEIWVPDLS